MYTYTRSQQEYAKFNLIAYLLDKAIKSFDNQLKKRHISSLTQSKLRSAQYNLKSAVNTMQAVAQ